MKNAQLDGANWRRSHQGSIGPRLTQHSQLHFRLQRILRHHVARLAAESRLVVARLRGEGVDVLGQSPRGPVNISHIFKIYNICLF